jgi:hypothetical protein
VPPKHHLGAHIESVHEDATDDPAVTILRQPNDTRIVLESECSKGLPCLIAVVGSLLWCVDFRDPDLDLLSPINE